MSNSIYSRKRSGHTRDNLEETRRKAERIQSKRLQVGLAEDLLKTWEELPEDKRDYDNERRLRAKVRQKRNELQAMGL